MFISFIYILSLCTLVKEHTEPEYYQKNIWGPISGSNQRQVHTKKATGYLNPIEYICNHITEFALIQQRWIIQNLNKQAQCGTDVWNETITV